MSATLYACGGITSALLSDEDELSSITQFPSASVEKVFPRSHVLIKQVSPRPVSAQDYQEESQVEGTRETRLGRRGNVLYAETRGFDGQGRHHHLRGILRGIPTATQSGVYSILLSRIFTFRQLSSPFLLFFPFSFLLPHLLSPCSSSSASPSFLFFNLFFLLPPFPSTLSFLLPPFPSTLSFRLAPSLCPSSYALFSSSSTFSFSHLFLKNIFFALGGNGDENQKLLQA